VPARALELRGDARLRKEHAGARLAHRDRALRDPQRRVLRAGLGGAQPLVRQRMSLGAEQRAAHQRPARRTDHEPAGAEHERGAGLALERGPALICALHQRHVARILEVRLADDAALPVRRAEIVRRVEAVETEHALAARGELGERGAPHRAEPQDDRVERAAHACASPSSGAERPQARARTRPA
jgi:hypothetical protein